MDAHTDGRTPDLSVRRVAWIAMVIADAGFIAWGAMAALAPDYLIGPRSLPILPAGYEGFTGGSWPELVKASPLTAGYITVLFRVFGAANVAFGLAATAIAATAFRRREAWAWWALLVANAIGYGAPMTYDRVVNAIGPFEALEYVGLALVLAALAVTAPFRVAHRRLATT